MINYSFARGRAIAIAFMGILSAIALFVMLINAISASAQMAPSAALGEDGKATVPPGFRAWVFLGAPLTPRPTTPAHTVTRRATHDLVFTTFYPILDRR